MNQKKSKIKTDKVEDMFERRPLKQIPLTPPDYTAHPHILIESYIEKEVIYAGSIGNVSIDLDPTNRTDTLKIIDRGKKEGIIPKNISRENDAIFSICIHNVKFCQRDNEELLLRIAIHEISAICYVRDNNEHIISVKYGDHDDPYGNCNMAVFYANSKDIAEEICSLIGQCFSLVYKEATVRYLDTVIQTAPSVSDISRSSTNLTANSWSDSNRSTPITGRNYFHHGLSLQTQSRQDLSQSGVENSIYSSASGGNKSLSNRKRNTSENLSNSGKSVGSVNPNDLIHQYLDKLRSKLNSDELKQFALLLKASYTTMPFKEFCDKILDLYGPDRKFLFVGMHSFIPEKDIPYFENFLERIGIRLGDRAPINSSSASNRISDNSTSSGHHSDFDENLNL